MYVKIVPRSTLNVTRLTLDVTRLTHNVTRSMIHVDLVTVNLVTFCAFSDCCENYINKTKHEIMYLQYIYICRDVTGNSWGNFLRKFPGNSPNQNSREFLGKVKKYHIYKQFITLRVLEMKKGSC